MAKGKEIKAVRKVLYDRERLREMVDEVKSIDILMNTNPDAELPPDDIRGRAGSGPLWYLLDSGELDPGVVEAADRCDRLATLMRQTRSELAGVDFDGEDKRNLRKALEAQARAWVARANVWRDPVRPDVERAVAEIADHELAAAKSYAKAKEYLHEPKNGGAE